MKKIFLIISLFNCLGIYSQNGIIKKAINNSYYVNSGENGYTGVGNVNHPSGLRSYVPNWAYRVEIIGQTTIPDDIIKKYIIPHIMNIVIDSKMDTFLTRLYFDLKGDLLYVGFGFATNLGIPLEAIEQTEVAMINECKLILSYNPDKVNDITYVMIPAVYSLEILQEEYKKAKSAELMPYINNSPQE